MVASQDFFESGLKPGLKSRFRIRSALGRKAVSLVLGPALFQGASAAERPQEILYKIKLIIMSF
jgi:hypothetical protein